MIRDIKRELEKVQYLDPKLHANLREKALEEYKSLQEMRSHLLQIREKEAKNIKLENDHKFMKQNVKEIDELFMQMNKVTLNIMHQFPRNLMLGHVLMRLPLVSKRWKQT